MNILLVDNIQLGPTRVWGKSSLNGHEWGDNRIFSNMPLKGEDIGIRYSRFQRKGERTNCQKSREKINQIGNSKIENNKFFTYI